MYPKQLQKLITLFAQLPGIGPRQATRFAFFILKKNGLAREFSETLANVESQIGFCRQCYRTLERTDPVRNARTALTPLNESPAEKPAVDQIKNEISNGASTVAPEPELCNFCRDARRDKYLLAIVEKESDLQNLEKTGSFLGLYHVLGGVVSPFDQDSPQRLHLRELHNRVKQNLAASEQKKFEVILATNSTTEGDMTALYIDRILAPLKDAYPHLVISRLGRGLSLGAELEYADEVTLKNALTNRK